ncbi:DNA replication terminus site-binding protein [Dickeya dianthicola]|uniref:DNA replication terminus site-binding protein n=1 Tax=Dickeya dianthicola TaxID=204039 RepID=UPI0013681691|nr:DNA replication terminus site-binding protein [Dickeya dianthicola]MCI4186714.1 DNA replication terminus site-binding protein [Dickeya dianthicola]MCI4235539.1 DNA replication terminus site-binding protein [Dickeya dianthicola]MCI4254690.1 DNA replication terminus site-binding protein [Dickeya dianthicola]MZG22381.1 DNA replication terminus site-binding protein [Dickeya dianthicola]MZI88257.1 DNA replication terminus site-binding protein [Dickeya dianthicola]
MAAYDLIERMNHCFTTLEAQLAEMHQLFRAFRFAGGHIFSLPPVEKGTEHDPVTQIHVTPVTGDDARDTGLQHFRHLFIHHHAETVSSKAAIRLPGVLCFRVEQPEYLQAHRLIIDINARKNELEQIITVESGLEPEQRFDFVHTHLKGLITLSAYRTLTLLVDPTSVRFGWANKNIIKNLTRDALLEKLEKSLHAGRSQAPYSKEQWASLLEQEIRDVKRLPEQASLKIKRPVKVQPIARVWYQEQKKQVQYPCPSPLLVLCRQDTVPVMGALNDYDADNIQHRHRPKAKPLRLLIPRLHLYTDDGI